MIKQIHQNWCRLMRQDEFPGSGCSCGAPATPGAIIDGLALGIPEYRALARASEGLSARIRRVAKADIGGMEVRRRLGVIDRAVKRLARQAARHGWHVAVCWGGFSGRPDDYDLTFRRFACTVLVCELRRIVGEAIVECSGAWYLPPNNLCLGKRRIDYVLHQMVEHTKQMRPKGGKNETAN